MQYVVVIEKIKNNYSAYVPDLPGCVAAAKTKQDVVKLIHEAIEFHLEGIKEDGIPIQESTVTSELVEV